MFRDMITRRSGTEKVQTHSSDGEDDAKPSGSKSKSTLKSPIKGKQTTLFGFLKPGPTSGTSKEKQKATDVETTSGSFENFENVDVAKRYKEPKGTYLEETVKRLGGRKLRVATMCR